MFESLAAIIISIKEIIFSVSIRRFLYWFAGIFIIAITGALVFEHYTGNFYFNRLNKKIDVLIKIDNQSKSDSLIQKQVGKEYISLIQEVSKVKTSKKFRIGETLNITKEERQTLFKFLSALLTPLIIVIGSWKDDPKEERSDLITGFAIIGLVGGFLAVLIPIIYHPWINYLGFPVIEFFVLMIIGYFIPDDE